ncbi:uncharacterized protein PGTG_16844 [Puccinia graminis f. sp. tritici CRL 75-36-700-3]|uniref:Uncharacterized protein n=1 Tax=Puccinia graminis f. sp. tritici (strain CRL 75-36-700-3 / race SCCL) TaxID=418459 RepID=E3L2I5_PUCGT|nr:uncharacterized protein PGTG_16844 [Puccinia graminis f. sp. tritici CRL 75-36-700-3]EFP90818.1 hypothetical protein PGTG_16844 [Puccinia graminis f. sp. tritici CRL 75-36-700-3]
MTKSTRSNRPELRGLLPAPTRPRGSKGAAIESRESQDDHDNTQRNNDEVSRKGNADPRRPASDYGEGYGNGSRRDRFRMLGSYPETPYNSRDQSLIETRPDQTPGQRARLALETIQNLLKFKRNDHGKKQSSRLDQFADPGKWKK